MAMNNGLVPLSWLCTSLNWRGTVGEEMEGPLDAAVPDALCNAVLSPKRRLQRQRRLLVDTEEGGGRMSWGNEGGEAGGGRREA